jgi:NLI interacting factor-like phosphatase
VKPILKIIDPEGKFFSHHVYRENCFKTKQNLYIKDLRILGRNLADVALVDNAAFSYALQVNNGIPIIPFYNSVEDRELLLLLDFLLNFSTTAKDREGFVNQEGKLDIARVKLNQGSSSSRRSKSMSRGTSSSRGSFVSPKLDTEKESDALDDFRPILREIFKMEYVVDPKISNESIDDTLKRLLAM